MNYRLYRGLLPTESDEPQVLKLLGFISWSKNENDSTSTTTTPSIFQRSEDLKGKREEEEKGGCGWALIFGSNRFLTSFNGLNSVICLTYLTQNVNSKKKKEQVLKRVLKL